MLPLNIAVRCTAHAGVLSGPESSILRTRMGCFKVSVSSKASLETLPCQSERVSSGRETRDVCSFMGWCESAWSWKEDRHHKGGVAAGHLVAITQSLKSHDPLRRHTFHFHTIVALLGLCSFLTLTFFVKICCNNFYLFGGPFVAQRPKHPGCPQSQGSLIQVFVTVTCRLNKNSLQWGSLLFIIQSWSWGLEGNKVI